MAYHIRGKKVLNGTEAAAEDGAVIIVALLPFLIPLLIIAALSKFIFDSPWYGIVAVTVLLVSFSKSFRGLVYILLETGLQFILACAILSSLAWLFFYVFF